MLVGLFEVEKVLPMKNKHILILEGTSVGQITTGMYYKIPFNKLFGITVNINETKELCDGKFQIISCFEEEEEFDVVFSMNIHNEVFDILDTE